MKKLIQSEKSKAFITVIATISCLALSPIAQAVVPAPGGGYPGGNTAEGQSALLSLTTGAFNTAVGYLSLRTDTGGSYNAAVGAGALFANTGEENTAIGFGALLSNTNGIDNTANGALSLFFTIPLANRTRQMERLPFSTTSTVATIGPSARVRSLAAAPAASARPSVLRRSLPIPRASATSAWARTQAGMLLRQITLFVSAPMVTTWTTVATSGIYSTRHLPAGAPCMSM